MKRKILFAASMLCAVFSYAQDSLTTMNEVVITANRYPNKSLLTGKVVTVITKEQIQQSGSKDLSQVLTEQAGVYVNGSNSNPGKDKSIYLRGAKVDHTLITIDGVPLYDPSGIGSNFDIRWLSIDNIERIEILKGSQSTLYGSDAIAGVINVITKRPEKKTMAINGSLQYGSYQSLRANVGISGTKKKIDYSAQYAVFSTKGINEATDSITGNNTGDKDGYTQHNFFASLGYTPHKNIRIQPSVRWSSFSQAYDQGAFTDELDLNAKSKNLQLGLKNEFRIGKGKLMVNYNYSHITRNYLDDSVKSRNGYDIYSKGDYTGKEHFADAFMVYPVSEKIKISGGFEWRNANASEIYHSVGYYGPYDSELSTDSLQQHQLSAYVSGNLQLKNGFALEAGTRWNRHNAYGSKFVYNINPSFLWKEKWKLFANFSTAYKTPTLYELYSEYGNKKLKPESAFTFEGGVQFHAKDNKIDARLAYFNRYVKDLIFFFYDPTTWQSFYINQDKQHDQGVDAELQLKIGKTATCRANFSYVNGKMTTINNGKDTSYFNLIRRPKTNAVLTLSNRFHKKLLVSVNVNVYGKRKDLAFESNFNEVEISLKGYTLLNLYLEYPGLKNKVKVFAEINNLTNVHYTEVYGFNTMGCNVRGGIRFNL